MAIDKRTAHVLDGSSATFTDRTIIGMQANVANASGANNVSTAVTFAEPLPATYSVFVTPSQNCTFAVTNKTNTGFNVVLYATSVAAGTFDVLVVA